ncbi:MAG: sugar ABC transporter permease [Syntrophomonas sp.]
MRSKNPLLPYILIAPLLLLMAIFIFYPLLLTVIDSLWSINLAKPDDLRFAGLANYLTLITDPAVQHAGLNSLRYFLISVAAEMLGGTLIALTLWKHKIGRGIILAIVIIPWALPPVVNGITWKWIYDPSFGLLNDLLMKLDLINHSQVWLGDPRYSLFWVALVHIWKITPLISVVILSRLQTIPIELYEAARIDGSGSWQSFRHITLPMLRPVLVIGLTLGTLSAFQLFDEVYVLTGTSLDTRSIMVQDYLIAFRELKFSLGMALSLLISFVILGFSYLYSIWGKKVSSQ